MKPDGWRRLAALAACVLISTLIVVAPDPDDSLRSAIALHDFGHVIAFAVVTALLLVAQPARNHAGILPRVRGAGLAASGALLLGIVVELAQGLNGGVADPWDVLRDAGGALFVAVLWIAGDAGLPAVARLGLTGTAILVLGAFTLPPVAALQDEARARTEFPVLASFESERELSRLLIEAGSSERLVSIADSEGRPAAGLALRLPAGKYPGVALRYFPRDWRGLRALQLLLVNPGPVPQEIWIRIDDADYDYRLDMADRYSGSFVLSPGANRIEIPLADVAKAPRGRRFDLGRVQLLLVHAVDLTEPREIILGPIVLAR